MRILVIKPLCKPQVLEIDGSLKSMQEIVDGVIQAIYPFPEPVAVVANDEGKVFGLTMNRGLFDENGKLYDILCGTFFICGTFDDSFVSLTDEQIERFAQMFALPELFVKENLDNES